ncbi:uncharacterized protein [Argopecten irradians]|uniref:uncharacterized protein n=1 Tax=Argopecten irradians TaxID=31199 RepID=UPI00371CF9DE
MNLSDDHGLIVKDDVIQIKNFNKRAIGRIIIKQCGNEGCIDNDEKTSMRRLLQEVIDYLPKQSNRVWENATVTIYDINGNTLKITSGKGGNQFFVNHNDKGATTVYPKRLEWRSILYKSFESFQRFLLFTQNKFNNTPSSSESTVNKYTSGWMKIPVKIIEIGCQLLYSVRNKCKSSTSEDDNKTDTEDSPSLYYDDELILMH